MYEGMKGLDDFFVAGYTPENLRARALPADVYLETRGEGGASEGLEGLEGEDWRPPVPLDPPPLPEFPVEALPEGIRGYVEALATFTQTPRMLAGGVALGAMATALAKKVVVEARPGWEEPLQLWTLTLLESGNRKTAVMQSMLEPFDTWERARAGELAPRVAEAESRRNILEQRRKKAEKDAAQKRGAEAAEAEVAALAAARLLAELEAPSPPQLITSDVTPEEVARLCRDNDSRIAVWSDEGEVFKIVAGRYSSSQTPNVETFLKGHSGGDVRVNRIGREGIRVHDAAVTMVLVVQPEVLASLGNRDTLKGLGYFARFLYGMPRSSLGSREVDPPPIPDAVRAAYHERIAALLDADIPKDEAGEIVPRKVRFSREAGALLKEFQRWIEPQLGAFGEMAALAEWGSKLPGAVVRVAGLLHVADLADRGHKPWEVEVPAGTLERAISIGCCYLEHSRVVLASMGADPRLAGARRLAEFVEHRGISRISARDLFQKLKDRGQFDGMDKLEAVLGLLEEYGYVRRKARPGDRRGGRPKSPVLEFNPLSPARNPLNPRNVEARPAPFSEWLAQRRGPEGPDDTPPRGLPPEPDVDARDDEEPPRNLPVDTLDSREDSPAGRVADVVQHGYLPEQTSTETGHEPPKAYELVADRARLLELAAFLGGVGEAALDIETTSLSPFGGRVRLLSLHADGGTYLVDCFSVDPTPVLEALEDKVLYAHGAEFDLPFLHHAYGFSPAQTPVDTLHLSQVVRAGEWERREVGGWERKKHSLGEVLQRELGVKAGDKKKYQRGEAWEGELTEEHLEYGAGDVIHLKPLAERLFALLEERGLQATWDLEQWAKPLFLQMCARGIPFDKERWDGLVRGLEGEVHELKERADAIAPPRPDGGGAWNWFSQKQAREAFTLAGLDVPDLKRETLSAYEHPLVGAVSEYRDARSVLSRHRKWYEGRYEDGRVHPHWRPCGAATGRATCTDPNVQALTTAGPYRGCVRPREGRALVKADVNQMELRVLAAVTGDETMLGVFRAGGDLNVNTAEAITGRKVKKSDPERKRAKAVNFGLSFGMGAKMFLEKAKDDYGVTMTLKEAKEAKRLLLDTYPGIGRWHRREAHECERGNFETRTLLGRRRVVEPDRSGSPKFTERLNAPVQGTAADVLKTAMANLWGSRAEHPGALPILTVHDEVVVECERAEAAEVAAWLSSALREAISSVLGHPELAGEEAVETTVIAAWGDG
ncbi:MAG: DNA polymerase [Actinomycetota bacterium]|nr:DNA polymerase [Actinomycetota bacterium]